MTTEQSEQADWPPRLTVEIEPVLRLFTGENFYSSADAALREAVLNAIDAIGRRQQTDAAPPPIIDITFDTQPEQSPSPTMAREWTEGDIENLFAKVGSTASQIARAGTQEYRAVGEFGIGALSYFLVSEEYHLYSCRAGQEPVALKFTAAMLDGKSHAQAIPPARSEVGTNPLLSSQSRQSLFDLLRNKFNHWIRNVPGLRARKSFQRT